MTSYDKTTFWINITSWLSQVVVFFLQEKEHYKCNICDFTTKWNYSLMRHTRLKQGQGHSVVVIQMQGIDCSSLQAVCPRNEGVLGFFPGGHTHFVEDEHSKRA